MNPQRSFGLKTTTVVLCSVGALLSAAALLAPSLGLDPSPGWGFTRTAFLLAGVATFLAGVAWQRFADALKALARRLHARYERRFPRSAARAKSSATLVRRLLRDYWPAFPLVLLILAAYAWFVSSGTWADWNSPTRYYADLARGFVRGKLYMAIRPEEGILAMENPWTPMPDESTAGPMDVSFYQGRFYLYWGPVPAVLLAVLHPVVPWRVGDMQIAFLFASGLIILQTWLVLGLWDHWYRLLPKALLWISIVTLGLASPVTFMLSQYQYARIYEAAILGGQFFLIAGLLVAWSAIKAPLSYARLALAGVLWSLALGTRLSLTPAVAILASFVAAWTWRSHTQHASKASHIVALVLPIALAVGALGWYNWARFGSWSETGLGYQLSGVISMHEHMHELFRPVYIPQNLYNYLLNPIEPRPSFPFLFAASAFTTPIIRSYPLPKLYFGQELAGILYTVPFVVFAALAVGRSIPLRRRPPTTVADPIEIRHRQLSGLVWAFTAAALACATVLLTFYWSATRYLEDVLPMLLLIALLGFWQSSESPGRHAKLFAVAGVVLAVVSILCTTLVAISVNDARFLLVRGVLSGL